MSSVLLYFALRLVQKTRATLNQSDTKVKINATQSRTFVQRLRQCAFTVEFTVVFVVFLFVLINKSNTVYSNGKQLHFHMLFQIVETHHVMLPQRIEKITSKAVGNLRQAGKKVKIL